MSAAEDPGLFRQPEADAPWPDGARRRVHEAPTTDTHRAEVGHAEVRAHARDLQVEPRELRVAGAQPPNVRRRPAHVEDDGVGEPSQQGSAPEAVRGARGEGEDGQRGRLLRAHHTAIVLAQKEGAGNGGPVGGDRARGERPEHRVQQGGVLPLENSKAPDTMRERDAEPGRDRTEPLRDTQLVVRVRAPKDRSDGGLRHARRREGCRDALDLATVEWPDRPPVVLTAATREEDRVRHRTAEIVGPVDHRRQRLGHRCPDTDRGGGCEVTPLDERVRERRRADVDAGDGRGPPDLRERREKARLDVGRGRHLRRGDEQARAEPHGVGVRPTHVDPDDAAHRAPAYPVGAPGRETSSGLAARDLLAGGVWRKGCTCWVSMARFPRQARGQPDSGGPIAAEAFFRFGGRRTVRCPETGLTAEVEIDARHAALSAVPGPPKVRMADCSLWPEHAGCEQKCAAQASAR